MNIIEIKQNQLILVINFMFKVIINLLLGILISSGVGYCSDDIIKLKKAALKGDTSAQFKYAQRIADSNPNEALKWLTKAATKGYSHAQVYLSGVYKEGQLGVNKDIKESIIWLTKAAVQGHDFARRMLSSIYMNGKGEKKNVKEALKWITIGAKKGYVHDQERLANIYRRGKEIPKNLVLAYVWIKVALSNKNGPTKWQKNTLNLIMKEITPAQLEKANILSKEYYDKYAL